MKHSVSILVILLALLFIVPVAVQAISFEAPSSAGPFCNDYYEEDGRIIAAPLLWLIILAALWPYRLARSSQAGTSFTIVTFLTFIFSAASVIMSFLIAFLSTRGFFSLSHAAVSFFAAVTGTPTAHAWLGCADVTQMTHWFWLVLILPVHALMFVFLLFLHRGARRAASRTGEGTRLSRSITLPSLMILVGQIVVLVISVMLYFEMPKILE